jgi:hypothetical protein
MPNPLLTRYRAALAEQGVVDPRSDDEITLSLGELARLENPGLLEANPEFAADYQAIREARAPKTIEGIKNTAATAWDRSAQALNAIGGIDTEDAAQIAQREAQIRGRASSVPWEDWQRAEGAEAVKVFLRDPVEITSNIVVSGLAGSVPALAGGLAAGAAGTLATGPVGGAIAAGAGTGAGSLAVEYGNKYLEVLREAGADLEDPESILRVVSDPEVKARAEELGLRRGLPVAAFDAISAGLAGKFLKGVRTATAAQNVRRGLAETAIQGGLGGGGEVAGAVSAGEPVSGRAVFEEIVGEIGPGAVEVGGAAVRRRLAASAIAPTEPVAGRPVANTAPVPAPAVLTPAAAEAAPAATGRQPAASPARRVALMTDPERAARLAELTAAGNLAPDQQQELDLLRALVGNAAVPAVEGSESRVQSPTIEPEGGVTNGQETLRQETEVAAPMIPPAPTATVETVEPAAAPDIPQPVTPPPAVAEPANPAPNFLSPVRVGAEPVLSAEPGLAGETGVMKETGDVGVTRTEPPAPPALAAPTAVVPPESPAAPVPQPIPAAIPISPTLPPVQPSLTLEQRLREELAKPPPFAFGRVNEAAGTLDLRNDARFEVLTPEEAGRLPVQGAMDETGNRALTRVAVVLEAPDGHYVQAGLLAPQELAQVGGGGARATGPAVQMMARETRTAGAYQKVFKEGGNKPALLSDVVASGYKVRAIVHFAEQPGRIFQRFDSREAYDGAYASTTKVTGPAAAKVSPTLSPAEGVARRNVVQRQAELQRQIDTLGQELASADPARAAEINEEISRLYRELSALPEPRMMAEAESRAESPELRDEEQETVPAQADRTNQFAIVAARVRQMGARLDVFAQGFLQTSLADEYGRRVDAAIERYRRAEEQGADADRLETLQQEIEILQERQAAMERVRGVTYSPWHIAIGVDDLTNRNLADLVVLIHEAGHALLGREPAMQARVLRAVEAMESSLRAQLAKTQEQTGLREASLADPEELVVSTLAQKLAAEGVPESPSVARAILQWVKDLYYRAAMALQAAFGREPSAQLALDWFENQLRRVVGGDYDVRLADLVGRFMPEPTVEAAARFEPTGGTPGGVVDFYEPLTGRMQQPEVLPESAEAVEWNLKFLTEVEPTAGAVTEQQGQAIPHREAKARIMAAAIAEEAELADRIYAELFPPVQGQERMPFDQFWTMVGRGDVPSIRLALLDERAPGSASARIGGERMTDPMNQQARVEAKRLIRKWQWRNIRRLAQNTEKAMAAEKSLVAQAKLVNKVEGDLRNAEMHEATLSDALKEMVRGLAKSMRRGLDTAFAAGELAEAVREAEALAERDPIPEQYQAVFRAILADEVPVFDYLNAIAKLDMPLGEMTRAEVIAGIEDNAAADPVLTRLTEPRNKPLLVALVALARKNAEQMDLLQLRAVREPERYLAIKAELDAIRNANAEQLRAIERKAREGKKAATFAERIKRSYLEKRQKLRRAQETIREAEYRNDLLERANRLIAAKVEQLETSGLDAPSEWTPGEGAEWLAMQQADDGTWKAAKRTLRFTLAGPVENAEQMRADLAQNTVWLQANAQKTGSKLYETVKRQTRELQMLDVQQQYPEGWRHLMDKMIQPIGQAFVQTGHAAGTRIQQMLNNFQFITKSYWHGDLETKALEWTAALQAVEKAVGITDHGAFFAQVYDPVLYYVQTEPGLEEGPALRAAVKAARARLPKPPAEGFDEAFKEFLRRTRTISQRFVEIAEQHGAFVKDLRLGGELRRAVAQGWLTVMRRVNSAVVSAITRDMQAAGWKLQFSEENGTRKVVRAGTFDALMPELAPDEQQAQARTALLENPEALTQAVSGFFSGNILRTWLEPFVNKPGEPVFRHRGEPIDQLLVQQAWQDAGGNVVGFIDALGAKIGLTVDENAESALSPEAEWRASMLRQIDNLFLMEARLAYEAEQSKNLFDPMGPKPHVVMDARINELIPPEHLQHQVFDPKSARILLATLGFHGAFGRDGERMLRALEELKSNLSVRKAEFDSLRGTTTAARKAEASARGIDYAAARRGARLYHDVMSLQEALKAQFGFHQQAGVLGDMRAGLELLHFVTGQTVNNPKTALLNLMQPAQRALVQRSLGGLQARATGVAYYEMAKQVIGSILENFGLHILRASEHARDIGAVEGQAYGQLPWSVVMSDIGQRGRFQESFADRWAIRPLRQLSAAQRKGVRVGFGESREFQRLNVIPGVGGVMNYLSAVAATANGRAEVWALERIVKAGIDHFAAHPEKAANPAYRLTAEDLGLKSRAWFSDEGSFDYYRRKTVEYGVGNLEDIVRGAMERQARGEQLLTRDQALRTAMMANNELDLQASINTRPSGWATNPILKFGLPLLGWPIAQMNQVHQALKTADGRRSFAAALKGLGIMAVWSLPIGLAFTLMTDEYDDKVLKKKSNLQGIDPEAAIPLVGPVLALAAGDRGLANVTGILQRLSRAGNIYGLGADAIAQMITSVDPTSGQRPFSLDQRVLVFSQFLNLQQALSNWINQGGTATYASVARPLIMSMGGNGALHATDVFNGLLGLDNAEARVVQRTNAAQWLRAAGREVGVELRAGGAGSVAPTPVSVWLREMQLSAYANDRLSFLDAYRRAVDAAREMGKPNPEQTVVEGWRSRDPLNVFRTKPDAVELARMYSAMSDNGRAAVSEALRLYEQFSELIAVSPAERYEHRILAQARRGLVPNYGTLRARLASGALGMR